MFEHPKPKFGMFTKVNWNKTGEEGLIYGIFYIGGNFFYEVAYMDDSDDTITAEEHDICAVNTPNEET